MLGPQRSWKDDYFMGLSANNANARVHTGKRKLMCKLCLEQLIERMQNEDTLNGLAEVRSRDMIIGQAFAVESTDPHKRPWLQDRNEGLLNHLAKCPLQPAHVKTLALNEKSIRANSPSAMRTSHFQLTRPPPLNLPFPGSSSQSNWPDEAYAVAASNDSPPESLAPSDSISQPGSRPLSRQAHSYDDVTVVSKRRRTSTRAASAHSSHSNVLSPTAWPDGTQGRFETRLARLTASTGFSLAWVENPEVELFFQEFLPQAKLPSRGVLTRRIIPRTLAAIQAEHHEHLKGRTGTLQCDGWTGINFTHLIAFMLTVNEEVYTVQTYDVSSERKTAENLLRLMEEVIKTVELKWKVVPAAFTSDASGESRKARRLLSRRMPHMVTPDCQAHQINLMVGDYFKVDKGFLRYSKQASELITWLRSKTFVLALIREARRENNLPPLSVIRAVLTRWTSHYLAFCRLLELKPTLTLLVTRDIIRPAAQRQLVTGEKKAKEKAKEMIKLIQNSRFWNAISRMKEHLEPLAVAANMTQSASCRLDEVLFTFSYLHNQFSRLNNRADHDIRTAVLKSIETRWSKCDQEVFIAAALLNPFIMNTAFNTLPFLNFLGIVALFDRLYLRFFHEQAPVGKMHANTHDYFQKAGEFQSLPSAISGVKLRAEEQKKRPNPLDVYDGFSFPGKTSEDPPLIRLAKHTLSICANSASCERLFSVFGNTLTKLRNRLGTDTLTNLAELKMLVRDEHRRSGEMKARLRRRFGQATELLDEPQVGPLPVSSSDPLPPSTTLTSESTSASTTTIDSEDMLEDLPMDVLANSEPEIATAETDEFAGMVSEMEEMLALDEDSPDMPSLPSTRLSQVTIAQLFNFQSMAWMSMYERNARRNLEEELELNELIDRSSTTSDGFAIPVDAGMEAIL